MPVRLREDPTEWKKFTAVMAVSVSAVIFGLHRAGVVPLTLAGMLWGLLAAMVALSLVRPRWFRSIYRGGMKLNERIGGGMTTVILVAVFLLMVTPLGLLRRCFGDDPLQRRPDPGRKSYWQRPRAGINLDRLF